MSDHITRPAKRRSGRKSVGVRELKTHAARILRQVRESGIPYVVTHRGRAIGVILPIDGDADAAPTPDAADARTAWNAFLRAGQKVERGFAAGVSGVRLLSQMRR
jgi:prevent-host-death family protein